MNAMTIRRASGTRPAATGVPSVKSVGAARSRATAVRVSAGRRFVMLGHTVKIVNPREGWECMKGSYATVLTTFVHDGSVLVEMTRPGGATKEKCCFASYEIEVVPMGDTLRHCADEETTMIRRCVGLAGLGSWVSGHGLLSEALEASIRRRADRLKVEIAAIQRHEQHDLQRQARWAAMGLSNWCTALVPCTGGAAL